MKVLTIITSYNREKELLSLLASLDKQETDVIIFDDNSDFQLDRADYIKFKSNYGKEYFWMKFIRIFATVKKTYDYYIILPDDISVNDNFISNAVQKWEDLRDDKKICLSILTDGRINKPNWTNFEPIIKDEYVQTQWQDFCFICNKEFFTVEIQPISLQRWQILGKSLNIELGSGLGGQISRYWHDKGRTMWHTKKSLVKHSNSESKLNPIERSINPL
jgi:glycosyltransferase involved in cell wall biosynthesis